MVRIRITLLFVFLQFVPIIIKAQTARLVVVKGTNVDFIFNNLTLYSTGVNYVNKTTIAVYFNNGGVTESRWKLEFKALSATFISNSSNTLPLNVLRLSATNGGPQAAANYFGDLFLTNAYQTLVSGGLTGSTAVNIVNISYDAGVINKIKNAKPDYYSVNINFLVSPYF